MNTQLPSIEETTAHEARLFAKAIQAVVTGNPEQLRRLLAEDPDLVDQRSRSPHRATLLHYVAANAIEDALQLSPESIYSQLQHCSNHERDSLAKRAVSVAQLLLGSGAEIDAVADTYGGGEQQTPLNLLVSSAHPNAAGVMTEMTEVLCRAGATLDGLAGDSSPALTALGFGHFEAADVLFRYGASIDNLVLAAAAGEIEQVKSFRQENGFDPGNIERCKASWFPLDQPPQQVAELALVCAAMCGRIEVVRYFIQQGVDKNCMPPGTHMMSAPLHTASLVGQSDSVDLLIELGCDPTLLDAKYQGNAVSWARHGGFAPIIQRVGTYLPEFLRATVGSTAEVQEFVRVVNSRDAIKLQEFLAQHKLTPAQLDGPWFYFDAPAVVKLKTHPELLECLLDAGANLNQKSLWWAGGFGVLDETDEQLAEQLLRYGAKLDVWSAAGLGRLSTLQSMIAADPALINARGPDGKTPLHCAKSVTVAAFLVSKGADLDAKCVDHESTPAQYLAVSHPEISRYLIQRGCKPDIMMAAALGDLSSAELILQEDPRAIDACIDRTHFPSAAADCIYSWTLGWYLTPHQVAHKQDHKTVLQFLFDNSPPTTKLLNQCLLGVDVPDGTSATVVEVVKQLSPSQKQFTAHAARNNQTDAVARLLAAGFPVNAVGQHQATALHWAAFHGNTAMAKTVLEHQPSLETKDADFRGLPLDWAREGCLHGWHQRGGDYVGVIKLLLEAGCQMDRDWKPTGKTEIDTLFIK